jgi:hypothetical protein
MIARREFVLGARQGGKAHSPSDGRLRSFRQSFDALTDRLTSILAD